MQPTERGDGGDGVLGGRIPFKEMSSRSEERKRQEDIRFLARLREATFHELLDLQNRHSGKGAPAWKKEAIHRAVQRLLKTPPQRTTG